MARPQVLVLRAPGTNCDLETAFAFEQAGGQAERLHVNRLLESPDVLQRFQMLCIPGGFSYGDDLAAGRILGSQIQHRLGEHFNAFRDQGKLILGICNGFQVLLKSGLLLPQQDGQTPLATLTWNESGKFEDRWVRLRTDGDKCVFFSGIESLYLPVAHAEGNFVCRNQAALGQLEQAGQLALRYAPLSGQVSDSQDVLPFPDNPNGSPANVAGICDETGRVCGLMPHPERHIDATQNPRWSRIKAEEKSLPAEGDGLVVFRNAVKFFL